MATNLSNLENFFGEQSSIKTTSSKNLNLSKYNNLHPDKILEKAKELNIQIDPVDIRAIVTKIFNIRIIEDKFDKNVSGFLEIIGGKWCIFVNQYENELRKRFTIAHELGHFVKHRERFMNVGELIPDLIFFRDNTIDPIEKEANEFAANLLMPKNVFLDKVREGYNTLDKLSDVFQLSTSAVKYRAYKLGLIKDYK